MGDDREITGWIEQERQAEGFDIGGFNDIEWGLLVAGAQGGGEQPADGQPVDAFTAGVDGGGGNVAGGNALGEVRDLVQGYTGWGIIGVGCQREDMGIVTGHC